MDAADFDDEQQPTNPDRIGQQTIETFLEFARQSSSGGGIPRLRSESYQSRPVIIRHLTREEPLTSSSQLQPPEDVEPPSPVLSPLAISPDCEEVECVQDFFAEASARPRSYSTPEVLPERPDPAAFQQALDNIKEMSGLGVQRPDEPAVIIARRLRAIAEEYNRSHSDLLPSYSVWSTIATALGCPHRGVIDQFSRFIKRLQYENFSWEFVVRFFMIGLRLLESLSSRNVYHELQSELLGIFLDFLTNKLPMWIEAQGGWESFSAEGPTCQGLRRVSSSDIFPSRRFSRQLERIPSERADGADCSPATTTSSSVPCSQRPLVCHLPEAAVSMTVVQGRSRAISVPARPTSLCLSQTGTSHSFPSQNSSFLHGGGLSHDAATQTSSTTSTTSQVLSAGVAFAFGVALGSFLIHFK